MIQFGETEKARQLIERSIELNPEQDGQKYFNMAELLSDKVREAIQMYSRGITVMKADAQRYQVSQNEA